MPNEATLTRIRGEYLDMPGLRLTLAQAERLCGVDRAACQRVFDTLVDTGFLRVTPDGKYARLSDGVETPRPHPAKAGLNTRTRFERAS